MPSAKKKRGPTYKIELPADGLGKFNALLCTAPRVFRQLQQATEPAVTVECNIDEVNSLAIAFRTASIVLKGSRVRIPSRA